MRATRLRGSKIAVAGIVAATSLGGAATAYAFIGAPGTGAAPTTNNPDLRSVTLSADNAYGDREVAKYCFDEPLQAPFTATNFYVKTYDASRFLQGKTATIDAANVNCVNVAFNPNVDLTQLASVGEVDAGAARNAGGQANYFSSAPVTGSQLKQQAGITTGPDLIGAKKLDGSNNQVLFEFDQPVDRTDTADPVGQPDNVLPGRFLAVDNGGNDVAATVATVDAATQRKVTVTFPPATDLGAARFAVQRGAVRTLPQDGALIDGETPYTLGPEGAIANASSNRPELASAEPRVDGSSQVVLTYTDEISDTFAAGGIFAVLDNGDVVAATGSQSISSQTKQRLVSFPATSAAALEPSAIVAIVSRTGAAKTRQGGLDAPVSRVNVGPGAPSTPGFTNAPDLVSTTIDSTASQAIFKYDEKVLPTGTGAASGFRLLIPNGAPINGSSVSGYDSTGTQVFVSYAGNVTGAVGVGSGVASVRDSLGNPSPYSSVSTTLVALPSTGTSPTTTTPPTTTTTPPGTTPPGSSTRKKVSSKLTYKIKGSKYTGRVTSSASTCKSKRTVSLKRKVGKKTKTIRKVKTKTNGTFSIKRTSSTKGKSKVYLTVSEKVTSTTNCTPKSTSKKRG